MTPLFVTLDEVLALHADQVRQYGGGHGLRSLEMLESALAVPRATFDGAFLHPSLEAMAAAYLFHLVQNHPFVDGNKRIGLMAALAFLGLNDHVVVATEDELTDVVLGVASGSVSKDELTAFFATHMSAAQTAAR